MHGVNSCCMHGESSVNPKQAYLFSGFVFYINQDIRTTGTKFLVGP
uniref:Uncharacterized protein n=1 Tax=Rhizophora mucronata TaxID=61149 RepID=A0A2P2N6U2_RHIMU